MDINSILERASKLKICVIGDLIEDLYVYGSVDRISPEAPIPVLFQTGTKQSMGGSGNVFLNLWNLGVNVDLYCNFDHRRGVFWDLEYVDNIFTNDFPHAIKTRFVSNNHQLLRLDRELTADEIIWHSTKNFSFWPTLLERVELYDAFVIIDYHKGVCSDSVINTIIEYSHITGKKVIVDTKKDFHRYSGAYCIKCNNKEATILNKEEWLRNHKIMTWIVTEGEKGISYYTTASSGGRKGIHVTIQDVCGAGDVVTAMLAIVMSEEACNIGDAISLANIAASESCKFPGVFPVTKELLIKRFNEINQ
jgi:D-beta-D-heptose 7-phosphate kinase/D-beta-D-heptose 1-phosphate adenosyltransferase